MFKTIDKKHFDYCSLLKIKLVTKVGDTHWLCHTDEQIALVKVENDVLLIGVAEREYDVASEMRLVGITKKAGATPNFYDVAYFLNWVVDEDYCWV